MDILSKEKSYLTKAGFVLLAILSVYFLAKIATEIKGYRFIGGGVSTSSTISFDGKGEVLAAPDLATVSFTIMEDAILLKDAQDKATVKENAVLSFLDKSSIAKKDIKTESYNSYPKYDYGVPCYSYNVPCRQEAPKIIGYQVSENISVKVRDLSKVGEVMQGIGALKVTDMSGPNFTIENEDSLKEKARKMAIDDAKEKAESLARDLGVHLVRIVNFSESGSYPPIYYAKEMAVADGSVAKPAPQLPAGENKITSNVTITYEIR